MNPLVTAAESVAMNAAEGIVFGQNGAGPLPQVVPQGQKAQSGYDRLVDDVNRLPRPIAALMALGMFGYATVDPQGFAQQMQALGDTPQQIWWLAGAVLTFFFGARETHYLRKSKEIAAAAAATTPTTTAPQAAPKA